MARGPTVGGTSDAKKTDLPLNVREPVSIRMNSQTFGSYEVTQLVASRVDASLER